MSRIRPAPGPFPYRSQTPTPQTPRTPWRSTSTPRQRHKYGKARSYGLGSTAISGWVSRRRNEREPGSGKARCPVGGRRETSWCKRGWKSTGNVYDKGDTKDETGGNGPINKRYTVEEVLRKDCRGSTLLRVESRGSRERHRRWCPEGSRHTVRTLCNRLVSPIRSTTPLSDRRKFGTLSVNWRDRESRNRNLTPIVIKNREPKRHS